MLYKARKVPVINAFKFESDKIGSEEYNLFKIESALRYSVQGICSCGRPMKEHGLIKGMGISGYTFICPGSYVIYEKESISSIMSGPSFEEIYKPVIDPEDIVADI